MKKKSNNLDFWPPKLQMFNSNRLIKYKRYSFKKRCETCVYICDVEISPAADFPSVPSWGSPASVYLACLFSLCTAAITPQYIRTGNKCIIRRWDKSGEAFWSWILHPLTMKQHCRPPRRHQTALRKDKEIEGSALEHVCFHPAPSFTQGKLPLQTCIWGPPAGVRWDPVVPDGAWVLAWGAHTLPGFSLASQSLF